ncbi:acylamino-acid-releasing enzyme 1 isoform X2 [Aristolochia californica]|uniref:acylamino-acid-releasing enzyme 1 isoform X2 n=1 Tax=Aristolochia californica TaxID=171875 RepID=UPI0035E1A665
MASTLTTGHCFSKWWRTHCLQCPLLLTASPVRRLPLRISSLPIHQRGESTISAKGSSVAALPKQMPLKMDPAMEEEYTSQSKLLQDFTNFPTINKAWIFNSDSGNSSQAMFSIGQPSLLANKKKTLILSAHITKGIKDSVNFQWSPFPVEMVGVSVILPSPSGSKLLVVRNKDDESPTQLEIWGSSQLLKEIHIPKSTHGSIYADGWFEGISWNYEETLIAYIAEEPSPLKPVFDGFGYKSDASIDKSCGTWKGQGEWEEHWGETYSGKRNPALFVINIHSEDVRAVEGVDKSYSVGQVVWAPLSSQSSSQYLIFVGWAAEIGPLKASRKLGIKYCFNRPCALYAVRSPFSEPEVPEEQLNNVTKDLSKVIKLTEGISSAFYPRFSPDGKTLVFMSAKCSVDTGAHCATNSLHKMDWPADGQLNPTQEILDVVPVVMHAEDGGFPGLYCSNVLTQPWLSDGSTLVLSSIWGSVETILSVNILSGTVTRISPTDSSASWDVLAVEGDNILAVSSTPINPHQVWYGSFVNKKELGVAWDWSTVSTPFTDYPEQVKSLLSSLQYSIMKIPVRDISENLPEGAKKPFEAIFVSSKDNGKNDSCNPLIVVLHGGPHSVSLSSYMKSWAFLSSLGYSLLIVNYRGSLGFGEEALQSLLGKIGHQDVNDVLSAMDHVIELGLADPSKVAVLGGSHGGFLTTHLIGQAPERFKVAVARNPVCNLGLMVGTTDIPDWCYVEAYGSDWKSIFTEGPSAEQLSHFHGKSPISHISKVKAPILFLLGAQDLRVPVSNGLQYARVLKEQGKVAKVIIFPEDNHPLDRPQTDFESYVNIGVWFKKYCK